MFLKKLAKKAFASSQPLLAYLYRHQPRRAGRLLLKSLGIADVSYRADFYTLAKIIDSLEGFEGAFIECGVYKGSTLLGVSHRLALRGMNTVPVIGCDSFRGFPEPTREDALKNGEFHPQTRKGVYSDAGLEELQTKIARLGYGRRVTLLPGYFEHTLPSLADVRFSLVHLDCDLYESYLTCLRFLYPRTIPGGYIVFDEYDYSAPVFPGAQRAIDSFLADKPEKIACFAEAEIPRYFIQRL